MLQTKWDTSRLDYMYYVCKCMHQSSPVEQHTEGYQSLYHHHFLMHVKGLHGGHLAHCCSQQEKEQQLQHLGWDESSE